MSKAVKKIGRAISKVVKGVVKAVKTSAKSKIGKVIITAAAIYFGGAALSGALSSTAGSSALTGISNAWTSLTTAGSQALGALTGVEGASMSNALGALGTGIQGGSATMVNGALSSAGIGGTAANLTNSAGLDTWLTKNGYMAGEVGKKAVEGAAAGGMSPLAQHALISGGAQLAGGLIQGAGAAKAQEEQRKYEEQQLAQLQATRNANMGPLWGSQSTPEYYGGTPPTSTQPPAYDPVVEARSLADRYGAGPQYTPPQSGMVYRNMAPTTNNNFPVYNPMYYRG